MRRVILLGASNLAYGFPLLAESLRTSLAPIELFAAYGHGRSYGHWSRVLGRRLPGIRDCGLWDAISSRPDSDEQPLALITDVGNDLLYGADVPTILAWVEECLVRFRAMGAAVSITGLPLVSVLQMSGPRYQATKLLFFPRGGPTWSDMRAMIGELDDGLRNLAASYEAVFVEPRREWYGFDPIHVKRQSRPSAWQEILSTWPPGDELTMSQPAFSRALALWRLKPEHRMLNGRKQLTPQPVLTHEDRSSVWLY